MQEDIQALKDDGMSDEDMQIIAGRIFGSKLGGEQIEGKTYKEILVDAKRKQAIQDSLKLEEARKQEELAAKIKKEKEIKEAKMRNTLTVSITNKRVLPKNYDLGRYSAYNVFEYAINNNQDVPINAVKFEFIITNALGDKIGKDYVVSSTDKTIDPNGHIEDEAWYDINEFMDEDLAVANEDFDKMNISINIIKVVLEDGTVLE